MRIEERGTGSARYTTRGTRRRGTRGALVLPTPDSLDPGVRRAFTLVELLVALAIISGVLLYLLMIRSESFKRSADAAATMEAAAKLEELLSTAAATRSIEETESTTGKLQYKLQGEDVADVEALKKAVVSVTFPAGEGTQTLTAQTIIPPPEPAEEQQPAEDAKKD